MSPNDRVLTAQVAGMLCYYANNTKRNQLIRVTSEGNITLEKIVFPRQRFLFEAMPESQLEIYYSQGENPKVAQIIPCQNLKVYCPTDT